MQDNIRPLPWPACLAVWCILGVASWAVVIVIGLAIINVLETL